ncbi:hypothetical protein HK102_011876, partial [Quaeritorhiza haematococci]
MSNSTMYIAWKNSTSGITLSQRIGTPGSAPKLLPPTTPPDAFQVPLIILTDANPAINIAFSFMRPVGRGYHSIPVGSAVEWIFAGSDQPPRSGDLDNPTASFGMHSTKGVFVADLTVVEGGTGSVGTVASGSATLTNLSKETVDFIHGGLMFIAWGVAPFAG